MVISTVLIGFLEVFRYLKLKLIKIASTTRNCFNLSVFHGKGHIQDLHSNSLLANQTNIKLYHTSKLEAFASNMTALFSGEGTYQIEEFPFRPLIV